MKEHLSGRGRLLASISLASLVCSAPAAGQGRVIAGHDVNTLSSDGAGPNQASQEQFAVNMARWLTKANSGSLLLLEAKFLDGDESRDYAPGIRPALESAGFTVTIESMHDVGHYTLADIQGYDAVFFGKSHDFVGTTIDAGAIKDFVDGGGGVYVFGGVAGQGNEADLLNQFLSCFGLEYEAGYNGFGGTHGDTIDITSNHPIFENVSRLWAGNGQSIRVGGTFRDRAKIVQSFQGQGVYAVFDPKVTVRQFSGPVRNGGARSLSLSISLQVDWPTQHILEVHTSDHVSIVVFESAHAIPRALRVPRDVLRIVVRPY